MENDGIKFVKIGASVLMGLAVVGFLIYLFTTGQGLVSETDQELMGVQRSLTQAKFNQYDNTKVSGSQVISCIRNQSDRLSITVTTAAGSTIEYKDGTTYSVTDSSDNAYINPTGDFNSLLVLNDNKVVTGITFTQN